MRRLWSITLVAALFACSGDDDDDVDGGPGDGGVDGGADGGLEPEEPAAPEAPAEPQLTPCPAGWVTEEDRWPATCAPWSSRAHCAGASAQWPGSSDCEPVGSACPAGEFPEDLPDGATVLYVRAGGAEGGSGTVDDPVGTIAEAMARTQQDTILALGRGTFDEPVRIDEGVTLWGACAAETIVTSSTPSQSAGVVTATRAGAVLRNVTIRGQRPGLWLTGDRAELLVEDVVIEGTNGGISVGAGQLTGHRVVVRDTIDEGRGIELTGGSLEIDHIVVERVADVGLVAFTGAVATLRDAAILDTRARVDGGGGKGIHAQDGASIELSRVFLDRTRGVGIGALGNDNVVTLEDVVVQSTLYSPVPGDGGRAITAANGSQIVGNRVMVRDNREVALFASGPGSSLTFTDTIVRDTAGLPSSGAAGRGLSADSGAQVELVRAVLQGSHDAGATIDGEGTTVRLTDVSIIDTDSSEGDAIDGRGLAIQGAVGTLTRVALERNRYEALFVGGVGAIVEATDLTIRDTAGQAIDDTAGYGIIVQVGGSLNVERASVTACHSAGVVVLGEGSELIALDLSVEDTESQTADGLGGRGLDVEEGAIAQVERARFVRNREASVVALGNGTRIALLEVSVVDTMERACVDACGGLGGGVGVGGFAGGAVEARRFRVERAALTGVQIARDGAMDLHEGAIVDNPVGANVQVDGYDLSRLSDRVVYRNNGVNLDSSTLPVPDTSLP